jgi:F-type H+-transporting ATPase subunit b
MNLEIQQILTQIVAFLVMFWILKKFAWKPLLNLMEERKNIIQSEFDSIEEQKKEVKKLTDTYHDKLEEIDSLAKTTIQEAVNKGHKIAQEIENETRNRVAMILNKAQTEMETEISQAKNQLKNAVIKMALTATEKIIQEKLDPTKHQKLIEEAIKLADFK